ncbi:TPA: PIG-L family deacetylase [Pseudomonas putida]|jgi:LmbE family N-acetylglucosaminyl deacetylase|uniref:Acetylglucosaminylphosphatidylinositol deacetylase n=3 Tax=Pseudomonas TaxID=286 RepID=A0A1Y3L8Q5_PSEPU|nr:MULTISPECIES: PIG-L family deacetylase [Pseudomonas]AGN78847.1 acetylglucosaminylphosphatidylinositol deacetylase [Pseudomonas putida H8234]EKT4459878.1 PIG-L family deacetylase [Pseudomonas putida]EKT4502553.1 PIG-L family deacetylase [Pseudomonas putida]EKT4538917.1 PIG-L family deacetylase [Pseudomonas putida]EKT4554829.1 PIG-L family deacetylase [Pseudomonas putida]
MSQNLIQAAQGTPWSAWQHSAQLARASWTLPEQLCPPGRRLVLLAPHPDDEILMAGGLLASFQGREQDVLLLSATNGEGSHPHSSQWPERRLRHQRPLESRHALQLLGLDLNRLDWRRLNLKDGALPHDEAFLVNHLNQLLKPGDLLLTTWRGDGHCDHEAAGRACAQAAQTRRVQLAEAPVWAWHWASPDDPRLPWPRAHRVQLCDEHLALKRQALAAHASQLQPDGDRPPVVPEQLQACLLQPFELLFLSTEAT